MYVKPLNIRRSYASSMAMFFLQLCEHGDITPDTTGLELPDLDAARSVAIRSAVAMMCDSIADGRLDLTAYIDISNAAGDALDRIAFAGLVRITG